MKFFVAILCVCLVQICFGVQKIIDVEENQFIQHIRDNVNGASERFIDDLLFIVKTIQNRTDVQYPFSILYYVEMLLTELPKEKNAKIDENIVRDYHNRTYDRTNGGWAVARAIDGLKVEHSILSKYVPTERLDGVYNLFFAIIYPNATSEEIESALGYLYGTETTEPKLTLLNTPNPTAADCPDFSASYLDAINGLKRMVDIKPKVIQDANAIFENFSCFFRVSGVMYRFESLMEQLKGDRSRIDACDMKAKLGYWGTRTVELNMEHALSTRLPDETFRGILNLIKASRSGTTIDEIQKALEYLYDDVPATKCP